jgi:hypothetical protein
LGVGADGLSQLTNAGFVVGILSLLARGAWDRGLSERQPLSVRPSLFDGDFYLNNHHLFL